MYEAHTSDNLTGLNASRKADRKRIAAEFIRIAQKFDAEVLIRNEPANPGYSGRGTHFSARLNGVGVTCSIDNLHGGEEDLLSWFNDYHAGQPVRDFSLRFNTAVGEQGHGRPHHKATSGGNWDLLAARLQAGLRHAANSTAFVSEETV
jgi:hypothetical protein